MNAGDLLSIQPTELKFPFELKKKSSCSLQLTNKTYYSVAFKVKTTNPKKYCVQPNAGVVFPGSTCDVSVTMQAPKEAPPDMQCKDKFLLQSVVAPDGSTTKDITREMFNKEDGRVVKEFILRVVYFPAKTPSPVPEGSDEGSSPRAVVKNGTQNLSLFDAVSRSLEESKEKSSEFHGSTRPRFRRRLANSQLGFLTGRFGASVRISSGSGGDAELGCMSLACTATTEIVKKKRGCSLRTACRPVTSPASEISAGRRKGTSHRAPLH